MITFSTGGSSAYKITFDDNSHYLQNGEITLAKNTLGYVIDESTLITLVKPTGDAYISFHIEETNFSSVSDFETWFAANAVGGNGGGGTGSGITSGEVQSMIDESISGKADTDYVNTALADKADTSAVTVSIEEAVSGKADVSAVTASINEAVSGKQDTLVYYSEDTENNEGRIGTSVEDSGVTKSSEVRVASSMEGDSEVSISASEYSDDYNKEAVFYGTQDGIEISYNAVDNVEGTSINHTIYVNGDGFRIETNSDDGESTNTTEFSVTPDGVTINGDEIVTESDLTASLSGKQDTLVAGSGITISGNVISSTGGGGATYSAGTNISIDTANTINCTLPITSPYTNSIKIGTGSTTFYGENSIAMGNGVNLNYANTVGFGTTLNLGAKQSYAFGQNLSTSNETQLSCGFYNKSNKNSNTKGDSGNTLFSVGNGYYHYPTEGYHNALEIRQNGDIYFADTDNTTYQNYYEKPMIRLQDVVASLGGFKIVGISQADYDLLPVKDPNTLYIITNVVNNS